MAKGKTRKELDKDLMYSKLMPSIPRTEEPEQSEAAYMSPPEPDSGSLSLLRSKLFGDQERPDPMDDRQTVLVNIVEDAVVERLDDAFSKFNCCRCDRCRKDEVALALNRLSPQYQVGTPAQLAQARRELSGREISAALVQAILKVRSSPRH